MKYGEFSSLDPSYKYIIIFFLKKINPDHFFNAFISFSPFFSMTSVHFVDIIFCYYKEQPRSLHFF